MDHTAPEYTYADWVAEHPDPDEGHPFDLSTNGNLYVWPCQAVPPCPSHGYQALYLGRIGGDVAYCQLCEDNDPHRVRS